MEQRHEPQTWMITPSLFLGDPPRRLSSTQLVHNADETVDAVRAGHIAVLPTGAWGAADEAMWRLGMGPRWRRHQLAWALTATILDDTTQVDPPEPDYRPTFTVPDPLEATDAADRVRGSVAYDQVYAVIEAEHDERMAARLEEVMSGDPDSMFTTHTRLSSPGSQEEPGDD